MPTSAPRGRVGRLQMNVESATMNLEPNGFKRLAKAGQLQIGIWSTLCSPINTEILADCGFDWILLDTEHSPLEVSDVLTHCTPPRVAGPRWWFARHGTTTP